MERAFIVLKDSEYSKDLDKYVELSNEQKKFINKYFDEKGIEAKAYIISGNGSINEPFEDWKKDDIRLRIEATENDLIKFGKMLCKKGDGLNRFKAKSEIGKDFAQRCVDEKVVINLHEPWLRDYFKSLGYRGFGFHRFTNNDNMYLKIDSDCVSSTDTPKGFIEVKLSEFYKAYEEVEKNNTEDK
jgi:hypothetical protein